MADETPPPRNFNNLWNLGQTTAWFWTRNTCKTFDQPIVVFFVFVLFFVISDVDLNRCSVAKKPTPPCSVAQKVGRSVSWGATQGFMVKFRAAKPHPLVLRGEKTNKREANKAWFIFYGTLLLDWVSFGCQPVLRSNKLFPWWWLGILHKMANSIFLIRTKLARWLIQGGKCWAYGESIFFRQNFTIVPHINDMYYAW